MAGERRFKIEQQLLGIRQRVAKADEALDVFDLRVTAQQALPPAHYGYIATGVDGDDVIAFFGGWDNGC